MGNINRRSLLSLLGSATGASFCHWTHNGFAQEVAVESERSESNESLANQLGISLQRLQGMLIGSLLGDALGGPIEFCNPEQLPADMPHVRRWSDNVRLNEASTRQLADTLQLRSYDRLRPEASSFGPWRSNAPAGTITDDTRHKIIFMRALDRLMQNQDPSTRVFDRTVLASEYLRPLRHVDQSDRTTETLDHDGFKPYRDAARWWVADQSKTKTNPVAEPAYPPERLWAGVANCSGQMALLPLAAVFPAAPIQAYESTYAIDFVDSDHAVDFCAAINAGLALVLSASNDKATSQQRTHMLSQAMKDTDPYRYADIPYTGRPFADWMQRGEQSAIQADQSPKQLFAKLETEGEPRYWWDAHFTFLVAYAILQFCPDEPLAALNLCLDFGHDSDSYAQLLGAWIGAIHGARIFPKPMIDQVEQRLAADFGESIDDWCTTLLRSALMAKEQQLFFRRGRQDV